MDLNSNVFSEAVTYDKNSSVQRGDGQNLIDLLDPSQGSSVLDLGCGTGFLTKTLADIVGPKGKVRTSYVHIKLAVRSSYNYSKF